MKTKTTCTENFIFGVITLGSWYEQSRERARNRWVNQKWAYLLLNSPIQLNKTFMYPKIKAKMGWISIYPSSSYCSWKRITSSKRRSENAGERMTTKIWGFKKFMTGMMIIGPRWKIFRLIAYLFVTLPISLLLIMRKTTENRTTPTIAQKLRRETMRLTSKEVKKKMTIITAKTSEKRIIAWYLSPFIFYLVFSSFVIFAAIPISIEIKPIAMI